MCMPLSTSVTLTLCLLGLFRDFAVQYFSKSKFSTTKSFRSTIRVSNSLAQNKAIVEPDLVPNCLQRLSADETIFTSRHMQS